MSLRFNYPVLLAALLVATACARDGGAQTNAASIVAREDSANVARLLDSVRGVNALSCELATRSVDTHGWWSRWGPLDGNPLEVDSASAAIIQWIQRKHEHPVVVPRLRAALRDPDACVRRVAGSLLGRVKHRAAVGALVDALDDASPGTRYVAAIGLGLAENAESSASLIQLLRDESAEVRRAAAWALGSIESMSAMSALIDLVARDADPRVRQAAAWAIGRIHD